ncbi:hypothetical protein A5844_000859 [Enterococcus sp. 10A9_DIV0425]|uniref:Uncharacterized protein n=1 Tax=Candidatus Enterococcus wittei TaxID=1987383 RepID=A0A2C9XT91_9ENTE|nr:hypothetical protein [Enterococcus sp. 10A9_DIV0425]OTP12626.1 hypothetical protein A5844_000859 [Enterococcus sp. 10A9_DIV0425]
MVLSYSKLQALSKVILKELNLYGGEGEETISDKDARLTTMKWVSENILGSSIEAYMIKKILDSPDPSQFTIGYLRKIFEMDELKKGGYITLHTLGNVSKEEEDTVKKLWILLLKDTLPNYFLETNTLPDELLISNYDSLMQLTGARLLSDLGIQAQFNQEEIQILGTFFWDKISKNGIKRVEELRYTVLPALLAVAQLDPDLLRKALEKGNYHELALSTFIEYHQNGYLQLKEYQDTLYTLFTAYQKEALNWRRKQALAQEVAQTYLQHAKGESLFPAFVLEQDYLLGMTLSINDYTSPNLEDWYKRLTKAVSDTHFSLDQKLIEFALNAFDPEEREFIFSPEAQLYEASAQLKEVLDGSPGGPPEGEVVNLFLVKMQELKNRILHLDKTDLFVAVNGKEERWYALKGFDWGGGYAFYRVDKDPLSYLKYGLLEQKEIWSRGYKKDREGVRTGKRYFNFSTQMDQNKKISQGEKMQPLIDAFSRKHSDKLYEALYKSGDDKAILEQIWDFAKHFIPFYDCVTGIIDKDATVAFPSCTIDIVFLIPIFGQATYLSSKFAMGMAKAMVKGGVRNAIRQGARFTPKISEIKSVLVNIRRYFDPGIESIADGSNFVVRELAALKNEVWVKKNTKQLLEKIDGLIKETPTLPKGAIRTYLPGKGLEVSAKQMEKGSYRLVTDLESGAVYGNPFWLKGNQLARFTDPEPLTEEQKALINRLTKEIDPDQIFAVAPNLNPNAYGNGEVMSVLENEQTTKYFITLNGHIVPVRVTPIEEHGVRYDVVDGEKIYPVNYNGKEWYFEPETSPFVSKKVADEVIKNIDEFESIKDPSTLSASGDRGLRWDSFGRSYIKIYGYYIPLIQLYKHWDWYHLVKKNSHQSMTVLVFEPENEQFGPETSIDREMRKGGRRRQAESEPSGEIDGQESKAVELPPVGTLPEPPERREEWNEFRNVIENEVDEFPINIVGDKTLRMDTISKFIPEPIIRINQDEEFFKGKILENIIASFKGQPLEFRVYKSLKLSNKPDFLKPFVLELLQDYKKAQERFRKAFEVCQEVLTKEKIADSPQGQYLIKMFSLEMVKNPEPILLEIVQRVKSVSKKGLEFLQKTADWGYENILIASSDLVPQEGSQEYRSASQKFLSTKAFTFPNDPECRIIFLADAFYLNPDLDKGKIINSAKGRTLSHETTHVVSYTGDLTKYYSERIGIKKTGKMMLEEYKKQGSKIVHTIAYKRFVREIAKYQNKPGLSLLNVWKEIKRNDLLRVNLQMTDAEMVMFIIRDFADKRNFEGAIRETRSLKDSTIGDGSMFMFSAVVNIYDYGSFEIDPELNIEQEQTYDYGDFEIESELDMEQEQTTENLDLTGAVTNESDHSTTVKREKREVDSKNMGSTEDRSNKISLNLKGMCPENSDMSSIPTSNQQIDTDLSKSTEKKSFLDIVVTSIERSIKSNPRTVLNQPISKNSLQH